MPEVLGTDGRIARLVLERERLKHERRDLRGNMLTATLDRYLKAVNAISADIARIEERMLDEARNYGQQTLRLEGEGKDDA